MADPEFVYPTCHTLDQNDITQLDSIINTRLFLCMPCALFLFIFASFVSKLIPLCCVDFSGIHS